MAVDLRKFIVLRLIEIAAIIAAAVCFQLESGFGWSIHAIVINAMLGILLYSTVSGYLLYQIMAFRVFGLRYFNHAMTITVSYFLLIAFLASGYRLLIDRSNLLYPSESGLLVSSLLVLTVILVLQFLYLRIRRRYVGDQSGD